jgi:hypothetical protein
MGMFDHLHYKGEEYQTKDTPRQLLDNYKIEQNQDDGHWYLWYEEYDGEWVKDDDAFLGGRIEQSNPRWVCCHEFDGNLRFYRNDKDDRSCWIEYRSLFMDGKMIKIKEVFDEPLTEWYRDGVEKKGLK